MKFSNLLWELLFGIGAMQFGVADDNGGGSSDEGNNSETDAGGDGGDGSDGSGNSGDDDGDSGKGQGDNKSGISDAEAKLLKEVMERKNALKKEREERKKIEEQLKRFEGIDPDEVRSLLKEKQDAETKKLEAKGEWDRLKAQMVEVHDKEKSEYQSKIDEASQRINKLQSTIADLTIGNAFAQSAFIRDELSLTPNKTRVVYGSHFEFNEEGKVVAYDKPAGSQDRTMLVDGSGEPLSFEAAMKKIIEADPDRDQRLRSKVRSGAGSKTETKSKPAPTDAEPLKGKDRIAEALAKGGAIK